MGFCVCLLITHLDWREVLVWVEEARDGQQKVVPQGGESKGLGSACECLQLQGTKTIAIQPITEDGGHTITRRTRTKVSDAPYKKFESKFSARVVRDATLRRPR